MAPSRSRRSSNKRKSNVIDDEEEEEEEEDDEVGGNQLGSQEDKRAAKMKMRLISQKLEQVRLVENMAEKSKMFNELVEAHKVVLDYVKDPAMAIEDAKSFAELCRMMRVMSEDTSTNERKFTASDYCHSLARKYSANQVGDHYKFSKNSLLRLGEAGIKNFKRAPTLKFVLGTLRTADEKREQRVPKESRRRDVVSKGETKTTKISIHQTTEAKTDNYVKQTRKFLENLYAKNGKRPVCYFGFVIDPNSFGRTVENMFHVSFLVKQRLALLAVDKRGLPSLEPLRTRDEDEDDEEEVVNDQAVITICMADWEELKTNLKIKEAKIRLKK